MLYRVLANTITIGHLGFVLFALLGGLGVLRWPWLVWLHLPTVLWAAAVEIANWTCPLTPLEKRLRVKAGSAEYSGGFVEHYLLRRFFPTGVTRGVQTALGIIVIVVNLAVYGYVWHARHAPVGRMRDTTDEHHVVTDR